jgi:undecaprenyl-diphosphatase
MLILHIVILALVQGLTEFLPVSSSAHLVLVPYISGWEDQGGLIDIAVHVGSLAAICVYLWADMMRLVHGSFQVVTGKFKEKNARLILQLIVATIPVVIVGFFVHKYLKDSLRTVEVIAWTTLIFGVLLYWADSVKGLHKELDDMTFKTAFFIGCAQILSLIPGVSRSGITMTAARFSHYNRVDTARFSMMLAIPTILGAGTLGTIDLIKQGNVSLTSDALIALAISFVTTLVAVTLMMKWLRRASFTPFVVYRIFLAFGLFAWLYL